MKAIYPAEGDKPPLPLTTDPRQDGQFGIATKFLPNTDALELVGILLQLIDLLAFFSHILPVQSKAEGSLSGMMRFDTRNDSINVVSSIVAIYSDT